MVWCYLLCTIKVGVQCFIELLRAAVQHKFSLCSYSIPVQVDTEARWKERWLHECLQWSNNPSLILWFLVMSTGTEIRCRDEELFSLIKTKTINSGFKHNIELYTCVFLKSWGKSVQGDPKLPRVPYRAHRAHKIAQIGRI